MNYSLLLWKKVSKEPVEDQIKRVFGVLSIFKELGDPCVPRYLTTQKKGKAKEFIWEFENFQNELLSRPVNGGNKRLSNLGYSASFFSSLAEDESLSFRISVGNQSPRFKDVIVINLPDKLLQDRNFVEELPSIFKECCSIFCPYWGAVTNNLYTARYGQYLIQGNDLPSGIHWINYWSEEILEAIGKKRTISELEKKEISLTNGVFVLRSTPIDFTNAQDVTLCDNLNCSLGLDGRSK